MCLENGGIQSCPESCQSLWLRYDSWAPGFVRKRSTVDSGGELRPAKTCQKIPKKRPLSAESYRRQDWRKYADSRGDPNRSSVAETKTRMSEILSELTSQSHVLKVVENSQCFLILIIPHLLVSTIRWQGNENTYLRKSWTDAFSSSSWGWCVCRARTSTRDDHACACVWSCSIFRKNLFFLSKFLPKKNWKSIYLWVPFRCWRKDFWKILAVHCKTAPIFCLFVCSVLFLSFFCLFINTAASSRNRQLTFLFKN